MCNILILDHNKCTSECLILFLLNKINNKNIFFAETSYQAKKLLKNNNFETALIEIQLNNESGFDFAEKYKDDFKYIFFFTKNKNLYYMIESFEHYNGFFIKGDSLYILAEALAEPSKRNFWADDLIIKEIIKIIVKNDNKYILYKNLSKREKEIFLLLAQGHQYKEIADLLFISPKTSAAHRYNIMNKLGLHSQAELLLFALSFHLIHI